MLPVRHERRGMALPLVLGAITILALLVFGIRQSSTETYRLQSLINHRNHATFMANAAIEECHDIVWNWTSNPFDSKKRKEVLEAVYGGGEFELDLLNEIKWADKVAINTKKGGKEDKKKPKTAILEAKAKFHNFRNIEYSSQGVYSQEVAFYKSPDGNGGKPSNGTDFFGFVTYTVKAQHGLVAKTIKQSRPIKIVDTTPMGREYALFEMDAGMGESLNEGKGLYIYGNDAARIHMGGPYNLDVEGKDDGLGSDGFFSFSPDKLPGSVAGSLSYPEASKWYDDAFIPTPKWLKGCAYMTGGRLGTKTIVGLSFYTCCPLIPLPLGTSTMGMYAQPNQQSFISGSIPVGEQNFSLIGAPDNDLFPNYFKGLVYGTGEGMEMPQGAAGEEDSWDVEIDSEIRQEGVIVGKYNTHKMQKFCVCFTIWIGSFPLVLCPHFGWQNKGEAVKDYYAYKGDKKPKIDIMATVLGAVMNLAMSGIASGAPAAGASAMTIAGGIASAIGNQLVANFALGSLGGSSLKVGGVMNAADIPNTLPSGFRLMNRAAVRHFSTMDQAMWKPDTLLQDGVFWVDSLNYKKDFKYVGKGSLAAVASAQTAKEGAFLKTVAPRDETKDFLNIWYVNTDPEAALKIDARTLEASVFSMTSILPQQDLVLRGNLMCSTVKKKALENDLAIAYWNEMLAEYPDYKDFIQISVSPKIDAYTEVTIMVTGATGDDGVQNVIDSI